MKTLTRKLEALKKKIDADKPISIMIVGLGSVGNYLLNYFVSLADPKINIVVVGRNKDKLIKDVNIAKTAATIRGQFKSQITVDTCDLDDVTSISKVIENNNPDFIVNTSRVYSGMKYGSISWHNLRAYGIWTPLSVRYIRNIMLGFEKTNSKAVVINTSYSDAANPWLKTAGVAYPDFGSGNVNHLIPRIKFYIAEKFNISDLNAIDITLATSHFHDVVISKEGQDEGVKQLLSVRYKGELLDIDSKEVFNACAIAMPTDQKRNMMNASSNFEIIYKIITALRNDSVEKIHSPGVTGEIGGYPVLVDCTGGKVNIKFDEKDFSLEEMRVANKASIVLDGIENVADGTLIYSDKLISDIKKVFGVDVPKQVAFNDIDNVGELLINKIIKPNLK